MALNALSYAKNDVESSKWKKIYLQNFCLYTVLKTAYKKRLSLDLPSCITKTTKVAK